MKNCWTRDKPMASLSTCHLGLLPWMAVLLNLFRYTSAAFELVLAARGIQEGGSWLLRDGSQASNDDITAFVIPLLSCVQRLSPAPRNDHRVSADNS